MKVRACLDGIRWREANTCRCAQRKRVKVVDAGVTALNSDWGIGVYLFVVYVGIGLVTVA
jgi:hypothetical protein